MKWVTQLKWILMSVLRRSRNARLLYFGLTLWIGVPSEIFHYHSSRHFVAHTRAGETSTIVNDKSFLNHHILFFRSTANKGQICNSDRRIIQLLWLAHRSGETSSLESKQRFDDDTTFAKHMIILQESALAAPMSAKSPALSRKKSKMPILT